ncbi:MAG: TIGR03915 family putative DNA repair protein [Clostridia bacterium]|nr:TIGR03915 family putative DNA repair protein [Clostridia bacterium]
MLYYKIENSVDGILSAIFESFLKKEYPDNLVFGGFEVSIFDTLKEIKVDEERVKRVKSALNKYNQFALEKISYAFRYGEDIKLKIIFDFAYITIDKKKNLLKMFNNPIILAFNDIVDRISLERHRFLGFVRFIETDKGILYSHISPDHDISDLLFSHFKNRLNTPFIIHDTKRDKVVLFNGNDKQIVYTKKLPTLYLHENEEYFSELFKRYFDSVNIKERKNTKLQDRYMPRRYRKNLTEFKTKKPL